jgi:hypothetical protein
VLTTAGIDDVQRGQFRRPLEVMNRPDTSLQAFPLQAAGMAGMPGSFVRVRPGLQRPAVLS